MTFKERRHLAAAQGKCGSCRARPAAPGRKSCEHCMSAHNRAGATSIRHRGGLPTVNICCQSHGAHRFDCGSSVKRGAGPFLPRSTT